MSFSEHIDKFFNKTLPKKFLIIVTSTYIVLKGVTAPPEYWYLLGLYFISNTATKFKPSGTIQDITEEIKKGNDTQNNQENKAIV